MPPIHEQSARCRERQRHSIKNDNDEDEERVIACHGFTSKQQWAKGRVRARHAGLALTVLSGSRLAVARDAGWKITPPTGKSAHGREQSGVGA